MGVQQAVENVLCGTTWRDNPAQNAHLPSVNGTFSPNIALSRIRPETLSTA